MKVIAVDADTIIIDARMVRTSLETVADLAREHFVKLGHVVPDLSTLGAQFMNRRGTEHGIRIEGDGIHKYQISSIDPRLFVCTRGKELSPQQTRAMIAKYIK